MCSAIAMTYDFETRTGSLLVPRLHCTDMTGCVELFTRIDPNVEMITVDSGDDVVRYSLTQHGWRASLGRNVWA